MTVCKVPFYLCALPEFIKQLANFVDGNKILLNEILQKEAQSANG